jgi:hypothetical protein
MASRHGRCGRRACRGGGSPWARRSPPLGVKARPLRRTDHREPAAGGERWPAPTTRRPRAKPPQAADSPALTLRTAARRRPTPVDRIRTSVNTAVLRRASTGSRSVSRLGLTRTTSGPPPWLDPQGPVHARKRPCCHCAHGHGEDLRARRVPEHPVRRHAAPGGSQEPDVPARLRRKRRRHGIG